MNHAWTSFSTPRGEHLWGNQGHGDIEKQRAEAIRQCTSMGLESFDDKRTAILLRCALATQGVG